MWCEVRDQRLCGQAVGAPLHPQNVGEQLASPPEKNGGPIWYHAQQWNGILVTKNYIHLRKKVVSQDIKCSNIMIIGKQHQLHAPEGKKDGIGR